VKSSFLVFVSLLCLPLLAKQSSCKIDIATIDVNYLKSTNDAFTVIQFPDSSITLPTKFLRKALIEDSIKVLKFNMRRGVRLTGIDTTYKAESQTKAVQSFSSEPDAVFIPASADAVGSGQNVEGSLPLHGVTLSGVYFVAVTLITAVDGSVPFVKFESLWQRKPMTKFGNYYIFRTGHRFILPKATYCFDIGGSGEYLPHVLKKGRGGAIISQIDTTEIISNDDHGYNFCSKPIKTDFFK
jgi:hypothetical protein